MRSSRPKRSCASASGALMPRPVRRPPRSHRRTQVVRTMPVPDKQADDKDKKKADGELSGVVQLVKDYARQETLGPLKGWGRYIAFGSAGALVLGIGIAVSMLGLL